MKTAVQASCVFLACIEQDNDGPTGWNFGRCALCPSQPLYRMFSIHGKTSNPGDGSVGLVRGVAGRRWPPSFSPTQLLWKTTRSCLMMLGAGSGIGCLLGVFFGVAVCCQLSGTRACWVRTPVSGPLAPAGNRPVPAISGPSAPVAWD